MKSWISRIRKRRALAGAERGISLIEILISLIIITTLVASLLSFYAKGQQDFFRGNLRSEVLEKSRYPLSWIGRDVKSALLVDVSHDGLATSGGVLILKLPCLDVNGNILGDAGLSDAVVYAVVNNRLTRHCHPHPSSFRQAGDRVLADQVAGLAVTYYGPDENILASGFAQAASVKTEVTVSVNSGSRNFR